MSQKELALFQMIKKRKMPQHLYKYRNDCQITENMLIEHTLWFADPTTFNDPFDCKVNFVSSEASKRQWMKRNGIDAPLVNVDFKSYIDSGLSMIGVLSLTQEYDNVLMWSHYADNHNGICLEFDPQRDAEVFSLAKVVEYVEKMPEYDYCAYPDQIIDDVIVPKFKIWEQEKEVRIIKDIKEISKNRGRAFNFNPEALKAIYFGCKMPECRRKIYMDICRANQLEHVDFYNMIPDEKGIGKVYAQQIVTPS